MNKNRKTRENIRIRKELKKKGQKYQIESICKSHKKSLSPSPQFEFDENNSKTQSKTGQTQDTIISGQQLCIILPILICRDYQANCNRRTLRYNYLKIEIKLSYIQVVFVNLITL